MLAETVADTDGQTLRILKYKIVPLVSTICRYSIAQLIIRPHLTTM